MLTTLNHQGVRLGRQSSGWGFPPLRPSRALAPTGAGFSRAPAFIMPLAALFGFPPWARPTLCPTPISHAAIRTTRPVLYGALAFIMLLLLAALYWSTGSSSTNAAFTLRPSALRGTLGGACMSTSGGAGTPAHTVLVTPASIIGSELPWLTGSGLCRECVVTDC